MNACMIGCMICMDCLLLIGMSFLHEWLDFLNELWDAEGISMGKIKGKYDT